MHPPSDDGLLNYHTYVQASNYPCTILKAYKYMSAPSFQDTENGSKTKVKRSAAHIS
jgi:hypothetical protein